MSADAAAAMQARLRADLKAAMRARDALETSVIRSLLAAIDNAQAVAVAQGPASIQRAFGDGAGEVARLVLSAGAVRALMAREAEARATAAADMGRLGRAAEANRMLAEAAIARRYADA